MLRRKSAILLTSIAANGDVSGASTTVDSTGTNTSHKHSQLHLKKVMIIIMYDSLVIFTSQWKQRWERMCPEGFSRWSRLP